MGFNDVLKTFKKLSFSLGEDISHHVPSSLPEDTGHYLTSELWRGTLRHLYRLICPLIITVV